MTPHGSVELWFSDKPDPAASEPLPYCAICTTTGVPVSPVFLEEAK